MGCTSVTQEHKDTLSGSTSVPRHTRVTNRTILHDLAADKNCACRALERAFASAVGRAAAIAEERRSGAGPAMAAPLQCKPSVCGLGRLSARLPLSQGLLVRVVALYWSPSPRPFAPWKVIAFSAARERPGVAVSAVLRPAHACGQCLSGARSVGSF